MFLKITFIVYKLSTHSFYACHTLYVNTYTINSGKTLDNLPELIDQSCRLGVSREDYTC